MLYYIILCYYITLYITHDSRFSCPTPILQYIYRPTLGQGCPVLSTIYCMAGPPPFFSTLFICTAVTPPPHLSHRCAPNPYAAFIPPQDPCGPPSPDYGRVSRRNRKGGVQATATHVTAPAALQMCGDYFGEQRQKQDPCSTLTLSGKECLRSRSAASKGFCVAPFVPTSQSHLRHR